MDRLDELLRAAIRARADTIARLHAEGTDCYRLLHGVSEGAPGVTVDRYGPLLLVQTFRDALPAARIDELAAVAKDELGTPLHVAGNHRGAASDTPPHDPSPAALEEHVCHEGGTRFVVCARHRGQDPWLFLDFRAGRRAVRSLAAGRSVLNLFAYTCGVGVVAAAAGARETWNVDFAASALEIGRRNARANGIADGTFTTLHANCLPVLRQLARMPVQRRGRHVPFPHVEPRPFDLVVLDPPRFAKTPFGTIDVVNDYQSLWKPCVLTLADGGAIVATNHVPTVAEADWHDALRRSAAKAGRPLRSLEAVPVDADFPSFDGRPPLKVVLAQV